MNERFKFRAWVIKGGIMIQHPNRAPAVRLFTDSYAYTNKEVVIEQFTGLHDRNDTEIYEGDLVEFNGLYEIKFGKHGVPSLEDEQYVDMAHGFFLKAQHDMKDIEPFGMDMPLNEMYAQTCEVIGNIHEHPHLLERD